MTDQLTGLRLVYQLMHEYKNEFGVRPTVLRLTPEALTSIIADQRSLQHVTVRNSDDVSVMGMRVVLDRDGTNWMWCETSKPQEGDA